MKFSIIYFFTIVFLQTELFSGDGDKLLIYNFGNVSKTKAMGDWRIEDDVVMGGVSSGKFKFGEDKEGIFWGDVSLDNNGGFSSVEYVFDKKIDVSGHKKVYIRLKGDGKRYQFRVKSKMRERPSYIKYFETNGKWQTVEISLSDMRPTFRGRRLKIPNYPKETLASVRFLIANGKNESFKLVIKKIYLR